MTSTTLRDRRRAMRRNRTALFCCAVCCCLAAAASATTATITQRGYFAEITDKAASAYEFDGLFRMSADASRVVFLVDQTTTDSRGYYPSQIRCARTDGTQETVVEQGFTYDTGVGNPGADSLFGATFDISDDGSRIVYTRLRAPGELEWDLMLYEVETGAKTTLLTVVPYSSYGTPTTAAIKPAGGLGSLRLSGDGRWAFFVNGFGPWGEPGGSGDPGPSGRTLYRVATDGSSTAALFSNSDIENVPGVHPWAVEINCSGGRVDVDAEATILFLPLGGNFPSANPPISLLALDALGSPSSARVIRDISTGPFSGPSVSGDGSTIVFRGVAGDPEILAVWRMDAEGTTSPTLVDRGRPSIGRHASYPFISRDGAAATSMVDLGGGSSPSIRWSGLNVGSTGTLTVSYPVVDAAHPWSQISEDGRTVVFLGHLNTDPRQPSELIRFEWEDGAEPPRAGWPVVAEMRGEPTWAHVLARPAGGGNYYAMPYYYTAAGYQPGRAFGYLFQKKDAWRPEGVYDFDDALTPDGTNVYVNGAYASSAYFEGDNSGDVLTHLAGVVDTSGTRASFSLADQPMWPIYDARYAKRVWLSDAGKTLDFPDVDASLVLTTMTEWCDVVVERHDRMPFDLPGAAPRFWRMFGAQYDRPFTYRFGVDYTTTTTLEIGRPEAEIGLWRSPDDGETWEPAPSVVDAATSTVMALEPQREHFLWALAPSAQTIVRTRLLATDDAWTSMQLQAGDLNADGKLDAADLIEYLKRAETSLEGP